MTRLQAIAEENGTVLPKDCQLEKPIFGYVHDVDHMIN